MFIVGSVGGFLLGVGFSIGCDGICFDRLWIASVLGAVLGLVGVIGVRLVMRIFAKPS